MTGTRRVLKGVLRVLTGVLEGYSLRVAGDAVHHRLLGLCLGRRAALRVAAAGALLLLASNPTKNN